MNSIKVVIFNSFCVISEQYDVCLSYNAGQMPGFACGSEDDGHCCGHPSWAGNAESYLSYECGCHGICARPQ